MLPGKVVMRFDPLQPEFRPSEFHFDLHFGHFVNLLDRNARVFLAIFHENDTSAGAQRLGHRLTHLEGVAELMLNIDQQHQIDGIGRQLGISDLPKHGSDILKTGAVGPLLD